MRASTRSAASRRVKAEIWSTMVASLGERFAGGGVEDEGSVVGSAERREDEAKERTARAGAARLHEIHPEGQQGLSKEVTGLPGVWLARWRSRMDFVRGEMGRVGGEAEGAYRVARAREGAKRVREAIVKVS